MPGSSAEVRDRKNALRLVISARDPCSLLLLPPDVVNRRVVTGTLLLVEDDPAMRGWLENALTDSGYIVHTATNGLDALRRLEKLQPDLIVLDIILPWVTGIEFLGEIARDARMAGVPVIAITAAMLTEEALSEFSHVRTLLRKPFSAEALVEGVQRILYGEGFAAV